MCVCFQVCVVVNYQVQKTIFLIFKITNDFFLYFLFSAPQKSQLLFSSKDFGIILAPMVHVGMVSFVFAVRWCMHRNASTPQKMFLMLSLWLSLPEGWVFSGASSLKTVARSVLSSCFAWTSCPSVFFFS